MDDTKELVAAIKELNSTLSLIAIDTKKDVSMLQKDVIELQSNDISKGREIKELKSSTNENTKNINELTLAIERLNNNLDVNNGKMDEFNESIKGFNLELKKMNEDPKEFNRSLKLCFATTVVTALVSATIALIIK